MTCKCRGQPAERWRSWAGAALAFWAVLAAECGRAAEAPLRVVTYGTSLTANGGWPESLAARLSACLGRLVELANLAKSGEASDWGLAHVDEVARNRPDVVTIEFSANDAALHRWVTLGGSADNLRAMVRRLRDNRPALRIILMMMNPMRGLRGRWLRPSLEAFYDSYGALARELDVEVVDHRPAWAALSEQIRAEGIPDGIHPTPALAIAIVVPTLLRVLAPGCRLPD